MDYQVAIIGGGAVGLMTAAILGESGLSVALLERQARCGRKLSATGNGQGNISNAHISQEKYHGSDIAKIYDIVSRYSKRAMSRLKKLGIRTVEREGRLYPGSKQASAVTDLLRLTLETFGVTELCSFDVVKISKADGGFTITSSDGKSLQAKSVVAAFGSAAAPSLGGNQKAYSLLTALGHSVNELIPSLVPLKTAGGFTKSLKGIKVDAQITAISDGKTVKTSRGDLLFTEYGVSGSAVFELSGYCTELCKKGKKVSLLCDFLPDTSMDSLSSTVRELMSGSLGKRASIMMSGIINKQVYRALLKLTSAVQGEGDKLIDSRVPALLDAIKGLKLDVVGDMGFSNAQIAKGGIPISEFDSQLMSRKIRGLFAGGELLDADGDCGGYNLHFAWCCAECIADGVCQYLQGNI